jgi:hypothetical protein
MDLFGYLEPVILDDRTGKLLAGHGRVEKLLQLQADGLPAPAGVDDSQPEWRVLTVQGISSRDDVEAEAMVVALNRVGERGGWRKDVLAESLEALSSAGLLDVVGFTTADLDLLLGELGQLPELGPTDPFQEWSGMPDFDQPGKESAYSTTIHFSTLEDAERFWGEVLGDKKPKRFVWWPVHDGHIGNDEGQAHIADEEELGG